nr:DUF5668 domain-containing protein [Tissierella sp.]
MKTKRVGTVSMALVLILFGILLLLSQFMMVSAVELFIKFWPLILIVLGSEVLYYVYRNSEEQVKIKYDVFSIFIVIFILLVNISIYGLMETGVMDLIKLNVEREMDYYNR